MVAGMVGVRCWKKLEKSRESSRCWVEKGDEEGNEENEELLFRDEGKQHARNSSVLCSRLCMRNEFEARNSPVKPTASE